jgi:CheY-like chemotaxis protein
VLGDPTQLHQVLLNLAVNARDAMPTGGTLTITVNNAVLDEHYAAMHIEARPGRHVVISVQDTGTGIPPEVRDKIFDPFFTTKAVGKGTGLGLSTSRAIVKSHGGFITVYSEVGRGTTFRVYLPAERAGSEAPTQKAPEAVPRGRGELILVADDEASIRQITGQTLQAFGYRVLLASDGADALALFASRRDEVALVITDLMMPVMDGVATIHALRRLKPDIRVIAASGLSTEAQRFSALNAGACDFLHKPYTAEAALILIARVLNSDSPSRSI